MMDDEKIRHSDPSHLTELLNMTNLGYDNDSFFLGPQGFWLWHWP
jgi:hypothetical protein